MTSFYFDIDDGDQLIRDDVGTECVSVEQVRSLASKTLAEIAKECLPDNNARRFSVSVRDQASQVVYKTYLHFEAKWLG